MDMKWVITKSQQVVHLCEWKDTKNTLGNVGVLIAKHDSFAKELIEIVNTMGLLDDVRSVAFLRHRKDHLTKRDFEQIMEWKGSEYRGQTVFDEALSRNVKVLYDISGIYDDIAVVKSTEISVRAINGKHNRRYLPKLCLSSPSDLIADEYAEDIRNAARLGACKMIFDLFLRELTEYKFDARYLVDAVKGISCERLSLPIAQQDVEDYFDSPNEWYDWGLNPHWALELCRCGAVQPRDEDVELFDVLDDLAAMAQLWKHACRSSGLPIALSQHEDLSSIDAGMLSKLAEMLSMDSYLDAYLAGVPVEDITV